MFLFMSDVAAIFYLLPKFQQLFWSFAFILCKSFMWYTFIFSLIQFLDISQFYLLYGCYLFGIMHGQILHPSWDSPCITFLAYFLWSLRVHRFGSYNKHWQTALHKVVPNTSPHGRKSNWVVVGTDSTSTYIRSRFRGHNHAGLSRQY